MPLHEEPQRWYHALHTNRVPKTSICPSSYEIQNPVPQANTILRGKAEHIVEPDRANGWGEGSGLSIHWEANPTLAWRNMD